MATTTERRTRRRQNREGDMPQAATQPQQSAEDRAREQAEKDWAELVDEATEGDNTGSRQVARAIRLEAQIAKVREQVNDNRDYLRLMKKNDELSEAQAEFLEIFYPEKEKGERRSAEDVEATRRARAAARKNGDA